MVEIKICNNILHIKPLFKAKTLWYCGQNLAMLFYPWNCLMWRHECQWYLRGTATWCIVSATVTSAVWPNHPSMSCGHQYIAYYIIHAIFFLQITSASDYSSSVGGKNTTLGVHQNARNAWNLPLFPTFINSYNMSQNGNVFDSWSNTYDGKYIRRWAFDLQIIFFNRICCLLRKHVNR